jgi:hypothetical protein
VRLRCSDSGALLCFVELELCVSRANPWINPAFSIGMSASPIALRLPKSSSLRLAGLNSCALPWPNRRDVYELHDVRPALWY